jgi:hypothetical protein
MLQVALAHGIESLRIQRSAHDEVNSETGSTHLAQVFCAGVSALVATAAIALTIWGFSNHIYGKGTALGKYWILGGSGGVTTFQWQDGYSQIPWQWTSAAGRTIPATVQPHWRFLGLVYFHTGSRGVLRIPMWLPILLSSLYPAILWIWRRRKPTIATTPAAPPRRS